MVISLIIIFILLFILDSTTSLANKSLKTKVVYTVLLSLGFLINLLLVLDIAPTSPAIIIEKIVKLII